MSVISRVLILLLSVALGGGSQTKKESQTKDGSGRVYGFAVAPMVLTDEGCVRDYVRAFQFEGVELRKRLTDLETYKCIDSTATGVYQGVSIERKDFAVEKGNVAYFRNVIIKFDPARTKIAIETAIVGGHVKQPDKTVYSGWIPEKTFYAVSPERFDVMLAGKELPIPVTIGR